mmetsp:Transcript_33920/g.73313  ORF Transcript_33920/g.73313 Transcript_33920/m.73313 type:complete len:211 (+) Transcript_33920:1021-1653(+)
MFLPKKALQSLRLLGQRRQRRQQVAVSHMSLDHVLGPHLVEQHGLLGVAQHPRAHPAVRPPHVQLWEPFVLGAPLIVWEVWIHEGLAEIILPVIHLPAAAHGRHLITKWRFGDSQHGFEGALAWFKNHLNWILPKDFDIFQGHELEGIFQSLLRGISESKFDISRPIFAKAGKGAVGRFVGCQPRNELMYLNRSIPIGISFLENLFGLGP